VLELPLPPTVRYVAPKVAKISKAKKAAKKKIVVNKSGRRNKA
jgi:hypothetical protein